MLKVMNHMFLLGGGGMILSHENAPDILFEFLDWAENSALNTKAGDSQKLLMQMGYKLFNVDNISNPIMINEPLTKGYIMILATKKNTFAQ